MIDKIKRMPKRKLIISLILLIGIILIGILIVTMAFINPNITNEAITNVNVSSCGYFKLSDKSSGIDLQNSFPMTDNKGMQTDPYIFTLENSCEENKGFNLYLVVTSESTIPEENIKINLSTVDGNRTINSLGLVDLTPTIENQYDLEVGKEIRAVYLLQSATLVPDLPVTFDLRMWLDDSAGNDVQNGKFEATIMVADGVTSSDNILYPELSDICLEEEISTCYAEYSFLDDTLIRHTEELEYSAGDNNYRFSGANPDNYVNFNNELWRIIGIYDESGSQSLKLVKYDSIDLNGDRILELEPTEADTMAFDSDNDNRWEGANASDPSDDADVNKYLNGIYYESMSPSATSMIRDVYYNIGMVSSRSNQFPKYFYQNEILVKTANTYNLALMQSSDYLYAASDMYWRYYVSNSDSSITNQYMNNPEVYNSNWLYNFTGSEVLKFITGSTENGLTTYVNDTDYRNHVNTHNAQVIYPVKPVVYLESDLILASGSGTQSDPLELKHPETLADVCAGENMAECFVGNSHLDTALLKHTASLENSAGDDNYRYSGGNDVVNNYICFGSDVTPCPEENKYRIIGIYDGSVKLIKSSSIGSLVWDSGNSNDYETSDISAYLNGTFYNSIPSKYQTMLKTSTWYVGGVSGSDITPKEYYTNEVSTPEIDKIATANIGLMNVYEYAYGNDFDNWSLTTQSFDDFEVRANNWLYVGINEFTSTPSSLFDYYLRVISSSGHVTSNRPTDSNNVRPSFYLKSSIYLTRGTGTSDDPYMIDKDPTFADYLITNHGEEEGLLHHTSTLVNGAGDNNYRYSGSNSVVSNNWMCFGSDVSPCPEENKYRIIGIYDGSVKVIKNTSIGEIGWNSPTNNDYDSSDMKEYLNNTYLNTFADKYKNIIQNTTWNVGGNDSGSETAYEFYRDSIYSPIVSKVSNGKIGLVYASDYGYAASTNYWTTDLSTYYSGTSNNWLFNSLYEYTIEPLSSSVYSNYVIYEHGGLDTNDRDAAEVRPTFYLNNNIKFNNGTGAESDPFRIDM